MSTASFLCLLKTTEAGLGNQRQGQGRAGGVEKAFPSIVSKAQFRRVRKQMSSRAPKYSHPRRVGSSYLLSGLAKCKTCNTALTGQYSYYVCPSWMKRGQRGLRFAKAQRPPLRGAGRQQDSLQHPHGGQYPRPGEGGG